MITELPAVTGERAAVLRTLLLDSVAARAVAVLAEHGVVAILLKGRVTATWLYHDAVRTYGDVDLLVDPAQRDRAVEVLGTIGYRHWLEGADELEYGTNEMELLGPNRTCIDLHHTLLGVGAPADHCWAVLSRRTERMTVGGRVVTVLDAPARTLHLALHVAQNGPADVKAVADLERGLAQLPEPLWREAAAVAHLIGARDAMAAGLRAVEAGRGVADRLDLPPPDGVELVLRSVSAPPEALQIQKFIEAGTLRRRLRFVGRKLWPTTAYMFGRHPDARGGPRALLGARVRRMRGLPEKLTVALRSWQQARRTVRERAPRTGTTTREKGSS